MQPLGSDDFSDEDAALEELESRYLLGDDYYTNASMDALLVDDVPRSKTVGNWVEELSREGHKPMFDWSTEFQFETAMAQSRSASMRADLDAQKLSKRQQALNQRTVFFYWAVTSITLVLVANTLFFGLHLNATRWKPEAAVMLGWLTTSLIEVIGLGYIIARSLFKNGNGSDQVKANGSKASQR